MTHHMRLPNTAEDARHLRILRVARDMRLRMDEKGWSGAYSDRDTVIAGLLLLLDEATASPATGSWVKPKPKSLLQTLREAIQNRYGGQLL